MRLYSDFAGRRVAQILGDLVAIAVIVLTVLAGIAIHDAIAVFAEIGRQVQQAGNGFASTMAQIGDTLGGIPLIGDAVRAPFDGASGAGGSLAAAGQAQQDAVGWIAALAGASVALGPILVVAAVWVVPRLVLARRRWQVRALAMSPDGPELLALRALTTRPLAKLRSVDERPLEAWRRNDHKVVRKLAALELRRSGVRLR